MKKEDPKKFREQLDDAIYNALPIWITRNERNAIIDDLMPLIEKVIREAAVLAITEEKMTVREIVGRLLK